MRWLDFRLASRHVFKSAREMPIESPKTPSYALDYDYNFADAAKMIYIFLPIPRLELI